MAHHGRDPFNEADVPEEGARLRAMREHLLSSIGATGQFPDGKMHKSDEGELSFAVSMRAGKIVVEFGKPVAWIGFLPDQAQELGMLLIKRAAQARGESVTVRIGRDE